MSIYCIGDLHGRYDLFSMALEKIEFDYTKDKMYILGDVIDKNYGAVKILKYIMEYPNSFELILGNHEDHFLHQGEAYDVVMLNDNIKKKVKDVMDNYLDVYEKLSLILWKRKLTNKKDIISLRKDVEVINWLKPSKQREILFESIIKLIEHLNYDTEKFKDINWILLSASGMFKRKEFIKELLTIDSKEYKAIKEYLHSKDKEIKFTYYNREFLLTHAPLSNHRYSLRHIPDLETRNQYVIFGHDPIPKIHKEVSDENFDFNYREIFSYIDILNNRYYNLDMGDNVASILRLDDFEEFYVMKYKKKPTSGIIPPIEQVNKRKVGYKIVDARFMTYDEKAKKVIEYKVKKGGFSFITYQDYCMEYLIGVNEIDKRILYKRINYMGMPYIEVINDWYENQSIEEIIEKVKNHCNSQKDSEQITFREKYIRSIS